MVKFPSEEDFLAWREKHPYVGEPNSPEWCPIACFLRDRGVPDPYVTRVWWGYGYEDRFPHPLPKWASEFIAKFDREARKAGNR